MCCIGKLMHLQLTISFPFVPLPAGTVWTVSVQLQALILQYASHPSNTKSKVAGRALGSLGSAASSP